MARVLDRKQIHEVVVILAGSRTGSSFLYHQLSSTGQFLCPQGEENPYYRLAGIGNFSNPNHSDEIHTLPDTDRMDFAAKLLLEDSGRNDSNLTDPKLFLDQLLFRCRIRYPEISFGPGSEARSIVEWTLEDARGNTSKIYPYLWNSLSDFRKQVTGADTALPLPIIEDTPFIDPEPKCAVSIEDIPLYPLLLKSSSNCFRIPLLRAMYPEAKFRWILLNRNPAATLSALIDGWQSDHFQSYLLPEDLSLEIPGYSDRKKYGDRYWKFDLPPGWQHYRKRNLAEVAAFQLRSSLFAIESFLDTNIDPVHFVRYEDLVSDDGKQKLLSLLQFSMNRPLTERNIQFPVHHWSATVTPPQKGKWKKRESEIRKTLTHFEDGTILKWADRFQYNTQRIDEWT